MTRRVTLVLTDPAGHLLGALPPFTTASPWWQEVGGFGHTVLRLLHADRDAPPGGHVTYLAVADGEPVPAGLLPVEVDLGPHPGRAPYAEVGGPAASLAWAAGALDRIGITGTTAHQQRTWNLSAIWRLDARDGAPAAWLKQVPSFYAHEPVVLRLIDQVAPGLAPYLMAAGGEGRMLLAHVPGQDCYDAGPALCDEAAAALHPVQEHFAGWADELLAAGVPDRRPDPERIAAAAAPWRDSIPGLGDLVDGLPRRLNRVAACGLPDTLIHGDLHPGNLRTAGHAPPVLLDWGDSGVGNPAFDILRLVDAAPAGSPPGGPDPLLTAWAGRWRDSMPGSDPETAAELLRPVASLQAAVAYAGFLAHIEPAEWPYHAADVPARLAGAVAVAARFA